MKKNFLIFFVAVLIVGCGGSGGSSSGGGSSLAGNYVGTATFTFTGPGGSVRFAEPAVLLVASNGQVGFALLAATEDAVCSQIPRVFLNGRSFSYQFSYSCRYATLGTCNIAETGRGSVNGSTATASVNGTARCTAFGGATLAISGSFNGNKQAASLSRSHKSQIEEKMREAMDI